MNKFFFLDIEKYYQLDSINYFALVSYLKTKNVLYPDIRSHEFGNVVEIIDGNKSETLYLISGLSLIEYKKVRKKNIRLSKIKSIVKILDEYFAFVNSPSGANVLR
jgi:hypothetical protein